MKDGFDPIIEGRDSYKMNIPEIESEATRRAGICASCEFRKPEPIILFRIPDTRIETNHNHFCNDDCGCALTYLTRQDSKICHKWKK